VSNSSLLATYPLVQPMAWTLVHFLWQGALVALALAALLGITRRSSPNVRYALALTALGFLAVLPLLTASVLRGRATESLDVAALSTQSLPPTVANAAIGPNPIPTPQPTLVGRVVPDLVAARFAPIAHRVESALRPTLPWMVAIWLTGITMLSVFHLAGWFGLARLRHRSTAPVSEELEGVAIRLAARLGIRRPVQLVQSALVAVPAVAGWSKPIILIPVSALTGMSAAELESVIAHELAHVRRHDYLVNLLQAMVEIVLFYHPAVWWVSRQVRVERELCCDDLAVAVSGDAMRYARALAHLEGLRATAPRLATAATSGGRGTLLGRIRRLVGTRHSAPEARFRTWFVAALGTAALVSLAATTPLLRASGLPVAVTLDFAAPDVDAHSSLSAPNGASSVTKPMGAVDNESSADVSSSASSKGEGQSSSEGTSGSENTSRSGQDDSTLNSAHSAVSINTPGTLSGQWRTREGDHDQIDLELRYSNGDHTSTNGFDVPASELVGFSSSKHRQFELNREAGTLHFVGTAEGDGASGTFTFSPNPAFRATMARMGYTLDDQEVYECASLDLTTGFVHGIEDAGQRNLPFDRLVEFRIHRVTGDFIKELASLGYPSLSAEKLVEFRIHGVTPEFVRAVGKEGYHSVSPDRLVEFRIHRVNPELLRGLADAGYRNLSTERLVEFAIHGVTPDYLKALKDAGYADISPERLLDFRIHQVDPEYLNALREAGYTHLSSDRLVEFRIHGVNPQELREYATLGYSHVSDETLVNWRIHGVRPDWLREIASVGYKNIDPEKLVEMRIHNVDAAFIREMQEHGHRGASVDEMISLRIHRAY
jgi:beta-lactamase regulating signal transducer with metallopeptidase domain